MCEHLPRTRSPSWSSRSVACARTGRGRRLRGRRPPRPLSPPPHHHYDHDLRDGGCSAVACAGPSPDSHFPEHGQQGCTLVQRQSWVDYRNVMQWFRRRSSVKPDVKDLSAVGDVSTSTTGKARNNEQPQQTRPVHSDISFSFSRAVWRFTFAGCVGFCRISSNSRHRCCERPGAHPPWRGGPDDNHNAAGTRGQEVHLSGPRRARHGVQCGERVQVQMCVREEEEGWRVGVARVQRCGWFEWAGGVYDGRVCCIEWGECLRVHMYAAFLIEGPHVCWCSWTNVDCLFPRTCLRWACSRAVDTQTVVSGLRSALCARGCRRAENGSGAPSPTDASPSGASSSTEPIYGHTAQDAGDKVRFSVELTRIDWFKDTYSLDIRRFEGNLRSYKFLYDTTRECVW